MDCPQPLSHSQAGEGAGAGVVWQGQQHRCAAMGVPALGADWYLGLQWCLWAAVVRGHCFPARLVAWGKRSQTCKGGLYRLFLFSWQHKAQSCHTARESLFVSDTVQGGCPASGHIHVHVQGWARQAKCRVAGPCPSMSWAQN